MSKNLESISLETELKFFEEHIKEIEKEHGKLIYVAIIGEKIVNHDADKVNLYRTMKKEYSGRNFLIKNIDSYEHPTIMDGFTSKKN